MAIDVDAYRFGYRISGVEPKGDAVYLGSKRARRAFWEAVGRFAVRAKQDALARGLDRMGREMAPIAGLTRLARRVDVDPTTGDRPYSPMGKADPDAPPLQATGARSRTRSLLRYEAESNGVWVYWGRDRHTGRLWGEVLARHARGFLQRFVWPRGGVGWVKPRDVLGASNAERAEIERAAAEWWALNRRRFAGGVAKAAPRGPWVARTKVEVVGEGALGGRYGPGTVVEVKLRNAGYAFLGGTPAYREPGPLRPAGMGGVAVAERPRARPVARRPARTMPPVAPGWLLALMVPSADEALPEALLKVLPSELAWVATWRDLLGNPSGRTWLETVGRPILERLRGAG
jgi:hypothetical protein